MSDGRFITARHCVEPWMFDTGALWSYYALSKSIEGVKVYAEITAVNTQSKGFQLKNTSFTINRNYDSPHSETMELEGEQITLTATHALSTVASLGNDWAVAHVGQKGMFNDGKSYSANLKAGTSVHLLGFPGGNGIADGKRLVDPIYNHLSIARDGLNSGRCIMVNQGVDHGNSGGPVFIIRGNSAYVIGIVSRGDSNSNLYNHLVPMSNL